MHEKKYMFDYVSLLQFMASKTCLDHKRSKAQSVFMAKGICTKDKPQAEGIPTPPTPCHNKIHQHHDVFYALCFMLYVLCMMMMMMMMMMMIMMNVGYQWNICCFSLLPFLFVEFVVAEFIKVNVSQSVSTNIHPTFKYLKHGHSGTTINCQNTF